MVSVAYLRAMVLLPVRNTTAVRHGLDITPAVASFTEKWGKSIVGVAAANDEAIGQSRRGDEHDPAGRLQPEEPREGRKDALDGAGGQRNGGAQMGHCKLGPRVK